MGAPATQRISANRVALVFGLLIIAWVVFIFWPQGKPSEPDAPLQAESKLRSVGLPDNVDLEGLPELFAVWADTKEVPWLGDRAFFHYWNPVAEEYSYLVEVIRMPKGYRFSLIEGKKEELVFIPTPAPEAASEGKKLRARQTRESREKLETHPFDFSDVPGDSLSTHPGLDPVIRSEAVETPKLPAAPEKVSIEIKPDSPLQVPPPILKTEDSGGKNNPDQRSAHPVLGCTEAKAWEATLLPDEVAEWAAMERAGAAIGRAVLDDFREIGGFPEDGRILVLFGKGHNGGDAALAARAILSAKPATRATVILCFGVRSLRPLAGRALDRLKADAAERVTIATADEALAGEARYALCLDGVFGFQFRAPMDAETAKLLARVNAHEGIAFRAAVDLPSGVGETNASTLFRADFTYATGIVKRPVLSPRVSTSVGRLRYLDLGFFDADAPPANERVLNVSVLAPLTQLRSSQTDKRTFGHVLIVGGSRSYPGAVMLATRAALRSGTGLVTAFVPATLAPEYAAAHPEAMWVGCPETAKGGLAAGTLDLIRERLPRASALLIGPGLSAEPEVLQTIQEIVRHTAIPLVLDADALRGEVVELVRDRPFIGTPHAGEFERIAPKLFTDGKFTAPHGVLVLKGPLTRVTDGKTIYHSPFGGPVLARGGSGDVLAGMIGGLLAQLPADPLQAAMRGVVWHGRAADLLARTHGQVAVEISEILNQLGPALHP